MSGFVLIIWCIRKDGKPYIKNRRQLKRENRLRDYPPPEHVWTDKLWQAHIDGVDLGDRWGRIE